MHWSFFYAVTINGDWMFPNQKPKQSHSSKCQDSIESQDKTLCGFWKNENHTGLVQHEGK